MERRVNARSLGSGVLIALGMVFGSAVLAPMMTGLSYDRLTWSAYAQVVYPAMESGDLGAAACIDGVDNDNDGFIDCADRDCATVPPCGAPAPTLSSTALLLLIVVLTAVGLFGHVRRRGGVPRSG